MYLQASVKRHFHTPEEKQRRVSPVYCLNGLRVCKKVFAGTLGIEESRVSYVIRNKALAGVISADRRGKKTPPNKTPESVIQSIHDFLNGFPKYRSHYSKDDKTVFNPVLTHHKLYELYMMENTNLQLSNSIFARELKKHSSRVYRPKKESCCSLCDEITTKLRGQISSDERSKLEDDLYIHRKKAEDARNLLHLKQSECKAPDSDLLCITFDLQNTMPIPYINTTLTYFKRQLWIYNFGISTRHDSKNYMFTWTETEGRRGCDEVGSCLLIFLYEVIRLHKYRRIHSFSDGCGNRNVNKMLPSLFSYVCENTHVESWTHSFQESGHSFLPNDTNYAKISRAKHKCVAINTPDEWNALVRDCKFTVIPMKDRIFNIRALPSYRYVEPRDSLGNVMYWLQVKWLQIIKNQEFILTFKNSNCPEDQIRCLDLTNGNKNTPSLKGLNLVRLYESPINISLEKYNDLQTLIPFIPKELITYFIDLPHLTISKKNLERIPDEDDNCDDEYN